MKITIEEQARHAAVLTPDGALPCSMPEQIIAERTEALAARLSQLEGSTRAALLRLDQRINVHEGDLAEQLASTNDHERRIEAIEDGCDDGAQLFDASDLQLATEQRDAAEFALRRLCDALGVLPGVGANEIPGRIEEVIRLRAVVVEAPNERLISELEEDRDRLRAQLRTERACHLQTERDLAAITKNRDALETARSILAVEREAQKRISGLEWAIRDLRDNDAREIAKLREQRDEAREERDRNDSARHIAAFQNAGEVERLTNERDAIREVVKLIAKAHGFEPNTDLAPLLASVRATKSEHDALEDHRAAICHALVLSADVDDREMITRAEDGQRARSERDEYKMMWTRDLGKGRERIEALQADLEHAQLDAARKMIAVIEKELGVE